MAGSWSNNATSLIVLIEQTSGFSGIFGYSPVPGFGNLIFSISASAGTDPYGNPYPAGLSLPGGTITGGTIIAGSLTAGSIGDSTLTNCDFQGGTMEETDVTFDAGGGNLLVYNNTTASSTFTSSGSFVVPVGVTAVKAECWGAGGGGQGGSGAGGAGGEYAAEYNLAVTPGETLTVTVGAGGAGGPGGVGGPGHNGGNTTVKRSSTTLITAHGGQGSASATTTGGTGSANSVHFTGGGSHATSTGVGKGGAGGGSSAGTSTTGNSGASNSGSTGGAGGSAPSGGGAGGHGGNGTGSSGTAGTDGSAPGGGGGTGGAGSSSNSAGGDGARGQARFTYVTANDLVASVSPVSGTDTYGNTYPQGISTSYLTAGNRVTGVVSITPSGAGVNTSQVVTFPTPLTGSGPFTCQVTANSTVPGTDSVFVSYSGVSSTGVTLWLNRGSTTSTQVSYTVEGQ